MKKLFSLILLGACLIQASLSALNVSLKPQIVVELPKNKTTSFLSHSWKKLKAAYHNATSSQKSTSQKTSDKEDSIASFIKNNPKIVYFLLGTAVGAYACRIGHIPLTSFYNALRHTIT